MQQDHRLLPVGGAAVTAHDPWGGLDAYLGQKLTLKEGNL
jgi:hypothetical protein